ncbi:hypothetical protein EMCRGX_G025646 [Ephydatia muelleri]
MTTTVKHFQSSSACRKMATEGELSLQEENQQSSSQEQESSPDNGMNASHDLTPSPAVKRSCFCRKIDEAYEGVKSSLKEKEIEIGSAKLLLAESQKNVQDAEKEVQGAEKKVQEAEKKVQDAKKEVQDAEKKVQDAKNEDERKNLQQLYSTAVDMHRSYASSFIQKQSFMQQQQQHLQQQHQHLQQQQLQFQQLLADLAQLRCSMMKMGDIKVRNLIGAFNLASSRISRWRQLNSLIATDGKSAPFSSFKTNRQVLEMFCKITSDYQQNEKLIPAEALQRLHRDLCAFDKIKVTAYSESFLCHILSVIIAIICNEFDDAEITAEEMVHGRRVCAHGKFEFLIMRGNTRICIVEAKTETVNDGIVQGTYRF